MPAGISYAGIPLGQFRPEVADWIERNVPPSFVWEYARQAWPGKNRTGWSWWGLCTQRPIRVGRLYWPRDASRFAVAHFLVTDSQLSRIRPLALVGSTPAAQNLILDDGNPSRTITARMYMLPARPLAQIPNLNGLHILTLVDERFHWWYPTAPGETDVEDMSWDEFFQDVAMKAGCTSPKTMAAVAGAYGIPCISLNQRYEYLPLLIDAIAYNIGQRVCRPLGQGITLQTYVQARSSASGQLASLVNEKQAGGTFNLGRTGDGPGLVPGKVLVTFPTLRDGQPECELHPVEVTIAQCALTEYTGILGYPGVKVFHDTAMANFEGAGTVPTNQAALAALTLQIAKDFYLFALGDLDYQFAGIAPWDPEALHDSVEWTLLDGEVSTRIQRAVWNDLVEELHHGSPFGCNLVDCTPPATEKRWFRLTDKVYEADGWIAYSWVRVLDTTDPVVLTWVDTEDTGGPGNFPLYEVNNIDLVFTAAPVVAGEEDDHPTIVEATRGQGDYWLCDMVPRWEFVEKTGDFNSQGEATAKLLRYDQDTGMWIQVEDVILIDANAP